MPGVPVIEGLALNIVLTVSLVGIPALLIWLASRRRLSLRESSKKGLIFLVQFFAVVWSAIAIVLFILSVTDLLKLSDFGYPVWMPAVGVIAFFIGIGIWKFSVLLKKYEE